jgi:hypothetical protein
MAATAPVRRPAPARPATRGAAAPARRPRPEVAPQPRPRPRLRLVDDARLKAAQRRRRTRLVLFVAGLLATGCLFALAAANAMLVSGQGRLDQLEKQVADAQSQYSANRLKVAELESPDHIVGQAQSRLGMVPPPSVGYLTPSETMAEEAGTTAADDQSQQPSTSGTSWAAAKPYLDGRP